MDTKRLEKLATTDANAARELARLRFRASGHCIVRGLDHMPSRLAEVNPYGHSGWLNCQEHESWQYRLCGEVAPELEWAQ